MPSALLRACPGGCGALVERGRCPACARLVEQRRGTAAQRGYDARWRRLRERYLRRLVAAGVAPVCGARLPGAPETTDSLCAAEGRLVDGVLDLDHIVPHQGQRDPRFWDPRNLQLLCHARCHPRKTRRQQVMGGGVAR